MENLFLNRYPYTDFHELNLSWIIEMLSQVEKTLNDFVSINALKYADPIQWNITSQYEKNTIVIDPVTGVAYISVQPVPAGVALINTDYWTVVFDLGQFVVRASKNFSINYESDTTTSATFASTAGNWLVWGDTLYKALVNITPGDTYVVNGNIEHFTMEEVIGHLTDLSTTDKTSLVNAINEVITVIGDLATLTTTDQTSIVNAINEVITVIGDLATLTTTDQTSIVNAINELVTTIGNLTDLTTSDQSSIVNAINEIDSLAKSIKVPVICSNLVTEIYVDDVSGDDDNDGLTISTPLKTFMKAFDKINTLTNNLKIILRSGTYDWDTLPPSNGGLSNSSVHISAYTGEDVTINLKRFIGYNSHVNLSGSSGHPLIINCTDLLNPTSYCDNSSMVTSYVQFNGNLTANLSSGFEMSNTTVTGIVRAIGSFMRVDNFTCKRMILTNSNVVINNGLTITRNEDDNEHAISAYLTTLFVNPSTITCAEQPVNYSRDFIRATMSLVIFNGVNLTNVDTITNKYNKFVGGDNSVVNLTNYSTYAGNIARSIMANTKGIYNNNQILETHKVINTNSVVSISDAEYGFDAGLPNKLYVAGNHIVGQIWLSVATTTGTTQHTVGTISLPPLFNQILRCNFVTNPYNASASDKQGYAMVSNNGTIYTRFDEANLTGFVLIEVDYYFDV